MQPHILVFSLAYRPYVGGAEIALEEIIKRLPQYHFTIVTARALKNFSPEHLPDVEEKGNVRIVRAGSCHALLGQYGYLWSAHRKARAETSLQKPDIVWGMMESYGGIAAARYHAKHADVPYLLTMQSGDSERFWALRTWFWRPWYRRVFILPAAIQAISNFLADRAKRMGARGRIEVIPNGVDVENFSQPISAGERRALRQQWGLDDDGVAVITASRLVEKNGIDTLIQGYARWRKSKHGNHQRPSSGTNNYSLSGTSAQSKGIPAALVIAGKGPQENQLKNLVRQLCIDAEVKFLGEISYRDLPRYYQSADVFVRPSRSEGLGNSFLEAMASGIPVIGTPVGGIPDFLKDRETGLMVNTNDPENLSNVLETLVTNRVLREEMVQKAKKMVHERYAWDTVAERMGILFERLLKERKP